MTAIIVLILRILLVISLYTFLGWAIYTIWHDLRLQSQMLTERKIPLLSLRVEEEGQETVRQYEKAEVLVGREGSADFVIPHDTVSSNHARLTYHHSQWWVEDLRSTNGTFLNDERIFTQTVLITGDELKFGRAIVLVAIG